jgi:hypothetical protein
VKGTRETHKAMAHDGQIDWKKDRDQEEVPADLDGNERENGDRHRHANGHARHEATGAKTIDGKREHASAKG